VAVSTSRPGLRSGHVLRRSSSDIKTATARALEYYAQ